MSKYSDPITATGSLITLDAPFGGVFDSLSVPITPTQDLHGYSQPWPGGGGKNLFNIDEYLTAAGATYTKNGDTYTITVNYALFNDPIVFSDTDINVTLSLSSFANGTTTNARIDILNSSNAAVGSLYADSGKTKTVNGSKLRFNWTSAGSLTISKPQLELGSTVPTPTSAQYQAGRGCRCTYRPRKTPMMLLSTMSIGQRKLARSMVARLTLLLGC